MYTVCLTVGSYRCRCCSVLSVLVFLQSAILSLLRYLFRIRLLKGNPISSPYDTPLRNTSRKFSTPWKPFKMGISLLYIFLPTKFCHRLRPWRFKFEFIDILNNSCIDWFNSVNDWHIHQYHTFSAELNSMSTNASLTSLCVSGFGGLTQQRDHYYHQHATITGKARKVIKVFAGGFRCSIVGPDPMDSRCLPLLSGVHPTFPVLLQMLFQRVCVTTFWILSNWCTTSLHFCNALCDAWCSIVGHDAMERWLAFLSGIHPAVPVSLFVPNHRGKVQNLWSLQWAYGNLWSWHLVLRQCKTYFIVPISPSSSCSPSCYWPRTAAWWWPLVVPILTFSSVLVHIILPIIHSTVL